MAHCLQEVGRRNKETRIMMTTKRDYACFVSGLSAGMAIAFLLTPRAGAEVRNQIKEKVNRGAQALREGKAAAAEVLEREVDGINSAIDAGKKAYQARTGRAGQRADAGVQTGG
jgi:hypothetical protein